MSKNATRTDRAAKKKADQAGDKLCAAVTAWVKALGGSPIIVGGITVQTWPGEGQFNFHVAVKVTGRKPELTHAKRS